MTDKVNGLSIKKLNGDEYWCSCCDNDMAVVEIGCDGSFKPFWACGPHDGEICLCSRCFEKLKNLVNQFE